MAESNRIQPPTTVRLTDGQRAAVKRLAAKEKRSVGNLVRVLLDEALTARGALKQRSEAA